MNDETQTPDPDTRNGENFERNAILRTFQRGQQTEQQAAEMAARMAAAVAAAEAAAMAAHRAEHVRIGLAANEAWNAHCRAWMESGRAYSLFPFPREPQV